MTKVNEKTRKAVAFAVPSVILIAALAFAMSCMSCDPSNPDGSTESWMRTLVGSTFVAQVSPGNDGIISTDFGSEPFEMEMRAIPGKNDQIEAIFNDGVSQCGSGTITVNQSQGTLSIFGYGDFVLRFSNNGSGDNPLISIVVSPAKTVYYELKR